MQFLAFRAVRPPRAVCEACPHAGDRWLPRGAAHRGRRRGPRYEVRDGEDRAAALKLLHPQISHDPSAQARLAREVDLLHRVRGKGVARGPRRRGRGRRGVRRHRAHRRAHPGGRRGRPRPVRPRRAARPRPRARRRAARHPPRRRRPRPPTRQRHAQRSRTGDHRLRDRPGGRRRAAHPDGHGGGHAGVPGPRGGRRRATHPGVRLVGVGRRPRVRGPPGAAPSGADPRCGR